MSAIRTRFILFIPGTRVHYVSVRKRVRAEVEVLQVKLSAGEFIQYLVTSPCAGLKFRLNEAKTGEIILSDDVPATFHNPPTFTRLWPVVGDRPQQESFLELTVTFREPREYCTFQVQHRRIDGGWKPSIDLDLEALEGDSSFHYSFRVIAG